MSGMDATSDPPFITPRYCPRCRRGRPDQGTLCPECGEALQPQGFCIICERHWLLPAGADCPKHDVPLEAERLPIEPALVPGEAADWMTVAVYAHPNQAQGPRIRLEAEGIPTFLDGERMGANSLYHAALGGVKLRVPRALAHEARILLAQSWAPAIEPDDDLDDAWEELAPEPGALRRDLMRLGFALILALAASRATLLLLGY
ncbi:MAG: hypothetical protein IRY99_05425 [Isosphaeraceae bacterium]|nr:hypothetical protein [Isosphaeraceae bacterium]